MQLSPRVRRTIKFDVEFARYDRSEYKNNLRNDISEAPKEVALLLVVAVFVAAFLGAIVAGLYHMLMSPAGRPIALAIIGLLLVYFLALALWKRHLKLMLAKLEMLS